MFIPSFQPKTTPTHQLTEAPALSVIGNDFMKNYSNLIVEFQLNEPNFPIKNNQEMEENSELM